MKEKLDKVFSLYIRQRDSNLEGFGNCCTCGKRIHYKEGHCGHFMSRRSLSTRWDEKNCALQCVSCNIYNQGRQYEFSKYIDNKYGKGTAEKLSAKAAQTTKMLKADYEEQIKNFKEKLKSIKKY